MKLRKRGYVGTTSTEMSQREKDNAILAREAAAEGFVLLKNEAQTLPLNPGTKIGLYGAGAVRTIKGGTGSGDVNNRYNVNIYDGLKNAGFEITSGDWLDGYDSGYMQARESWKTEIFRKLNEECNGNFFEAYSTTPFSMPAGAAIDAAAAKADGAEVGIYVLARIAGENADRRDEPGDYYITEEERAQITALCEAYEKVILVVNTGGLIDLAFTDEFSNITAILQFVQAGQEGGNALADVISGKVTPSGKMTDTWALDYMDYPNAAYFSHKSGDVYREEYREGIYVGYRYFDTFDIPVRYSFGYGLSYTDFDIKVTDVSKKISSKGRPSFSVSVDVTNIGAAYSGKEVVQVYIAKPQGKLGKPAKELAAFEKTRELQPGESQLMILTWEINDMASYDDLGKVKKSAYVLEAGSYDIYVGTSVRDVTKADYSYILNHDVITEQLSAKLVPTSLPKRMLADGSYEALPQSEPVDTDYSAIGNIDPSLTEGVAPGQRAIPYFRFADGMAKNGSHDIMDVVEGRITLDEFVSELSIDDLIHLLGGQPNTGVANTFGIGNMPEYGIPSVMTADGPAGVRIAPEVGICTTAFPCSTLLACTWNPDVLEAVGRAGGEELKENNLALWLTPAICIHRSPLCGRNFEYYSEDPFVTGKLAGAMVRGIQSNNVGATLKHFALNNKETNRKNSDSRVSERAAREIYLKAFEMIVKNNNPWAIMSSYNMINGYRASESEDLLTGILRDEWGYEGMVTSDWWTCGEHYKETKAGNDLKMGNGYPDRVKKAYDKSAISRSEMETSVKRILGFILKLD